MEMESGDREEEMTHTDHVTKDKNWSRKNVFHLSRQGVLGGH